MSKKKNSKAIDLSLKNINKALETCKTDLSNMTFPFPEGEAMKQKAINNLNGIYKKLNRKSNNP